MSPRRPEESVDRDRRTDEAEGPDDPVGGNRWTEPPPDRPDEHADPQENRAQASASPVDTDVPSPEGGPFEMGPRPRLEPPDRDGGGEPLPSPVWDPRLGRWATQPDLEPIFRPRPRPTWRSPQVFRAALAGALAGALVAAAVALTITEFDTGRETVVERVLEPPITGSRDGETSIVEIASRARPWVVNVNVLQAAGLGGGTVRRGTGSGVILRSDGHIVTNAHVVQDADRLRVTLANGDELSADLIGADQDTDIAVIKVDREDLPAAVVGTAKDLKVGELAVAIGSPLGLQQTVTAGIVSALGRRVDRPNLPPLVDMIQTDAPITQGNSGGALIDSNGALVGINTAIAASPDVGAEGIAFAIPIDVVKEVADELIQSGRATHPWLGVIGANIDAETARQFGIGQGARIIEVAPDSPADEAGLRPDDVIVGFDGETITSMDELVVEIRLREVGDEVALEVVRDGETITVTVVLGDRPADVQL